MEVIRELVDLVSRNKLKSIELLGQAEQGRTSMVNSLYFKIASGEFLSDEEAATYYFDAQPADQSYRKLKNRLKNRLINAVFFIDTKQPGYTDWDQAYITCCKEWAAVKILLNRGASKVAVDLALKIFKHAQYYQFSELLVNISKILRLYYSTRQPDARKLKYYDELHAEYVRLWQCENLAEDLYIRLVHNHLINRSQAAPGSSLAKTYYEQLRPLMEEHRSYHFLRHVYLLKVAALMEEGNYMETAIACDEAINALAAIAFVPPQAFLTFLYQKLVCHIQLKDYPTGRTVVERALELENEGSFNWYKNRALCLLLALHTRNYQQAYSIWQHATCHPSFKQLGKRSAEHWKIYEAWLQYLIFIGKLSIYPPETNSKFRLNKFLNEVPTFSKDKKGMNIPILIIQILFMIAQKRFDAVIDRMEAIDRYCSRYLKQDENYRCNVFIRLLLQIPKAHFHPQAIRPRAERYLAMLRQQPLQISPQGHEIEIVPFEDLWEMTGATLGRKGG